MTDPYDPENFRRQLDAATDAQKEAVIMAALKLNHELGYGWHSGPSAQEAFKEVCDTLIPVVGEWIRDEPEAPTTSEEKQNSR